MKKGIGALLLGLILLLAACGDNEDAISVKDTDIKNPFKSSTVQADEFGKSSLKGNVSSGAKVTLERKPVEVNKDGSFKVTLENYEDEEVYYSVEVNEENRHWNSFLITVEPSIAKIKANDSEEEKEQQELVTKAKAALAKAEKSLNRNDLDSATSLVDKIGMGYLDNLLEQRDALELKIKAKEDKEAKASEIATAKNNASEISYNMLKKNADTYMGKPYYAKGEVIQAIEDGGTTLLRVNITQGDYVWEDTVAVIYDGITDAVEDDIIEVYGTIYGNYSYDTTIGGSATIPGITATSLTVVK